MKLREAIDRECVKLIARHHESHANARALTRRFVRATGVESTTRAKEPRHWALASWFDPFKVRDRVDVIAKGMMHALSDDRYRPHPALVVEIAKPTGGVRPVSMFPVADAALASATYKSILRRNAPRLSPFSYAYREDIGAHDAIERLWRETAVRTHHFLVEFDFSKYFDTIEHTALVGTIEAHFKLTKLERKIVASILSVRRAFGHEAYRKESFFACLRGVPQGNSLSLFFANVACHDLDLDLTRSGALFARYADDILVVCRSREHAEEARERILSHCTRTGLAVNFSKSPGISEVGPHGFRTASTIRTYFDYLGHRFNHRLVNKRGSPALHVVRRLSMRPSTEARVRAKLGTIVFSHLLRYPGKGLYKSERVDLAAGVDWDLVTCINDLRRYVYGGMPETEIREAVTNRSSRVHVPRGIMAFFPQINDVEQLRRLDGWLLHAVEGAIGLRQQLLQAKHGVSQYPYLSAQRLLAADWYDAKKAGIPNDVRFPSFMRAWKYSRRALNSLGLKQFPARRVRPDDEDLYE